MMRLIGQLTDLPGWQRRIFDPEWTSGWASTAMRIEEDFTADMAAWVRLHTLFILSSLLKVN